MKLKTKLIPMIIIGIFLALGVTEVHASSNLVTTPENNIFYTRRGGGQPYVSANYVAYDMDGKHVYCIEPGIDITTHIYEGKEGWINSPYSKEINQKIQLIGYYGYDFPGHQTLRYRMAAQALIWETVSGQIIEFWTERYGNGDYINLDYERGQIMSLVNAHYQKPSFNGTIQTMTIGQTITFADQHHVLSQYEVYQSKNATVTIEGNSLYVTPTVVGEVEISLKRKTYSNDPSIIFVGVDGKSQKMAYFRVNDPVVSSVKVKSIGGKVTVEKYDATTLELRPQGDAELKGALYGIYTPDDVRIGQITIGSDHKATSDSLPSLGYYYLKEEVASHGYNLDPTKYYFEITKDNLYPTIRVYEDVISRDVTFFKVFADGSTTILVGEPNIEFEFTLKSTGKLYTTAVTDDKGYLNIKQMPFGTYLVHQKNTTPNHEKINDFEITIDIETEEPLYKIISNADLTAKLKVYKIDQETGNIVARSGFRFKIYDYTRKEYVCQTITYPTATTICEFETNKDGYLITPDALKSGKYRLEEVDQVMDGYLWNPSSQDFEIDEDSKLITDHEFGILLETKFPNTAVKGEIEVIKIGEKLVIDDNSYYYEEIKLDGIIYDLYADGDIYSADGTLIYQDGDLITTKTTVDGSFKIRNLFLGTYCLAEQATLDGYVLDQEKHCFSLAYQDQYTPIVSLSFTFKNHLKKGTLEFTKSDLVTGNPIPNTWIEIYTENDELIFSGYTDQSGQVILKDLFVGKGYIKEKESAETYQKIDDIIYFEIKENGEIVKADMTNEKIKVPNTGLGDSKIINIIGIISMIAGVIFIIYDKHKKK